MMTRATRAAAWAVVGVLTLVACGNSSARAAVKSFDQVQASPVVFQADPTDPSRAIAHLTTKVAMICAIVWGTDSSFGRFDNSEAMNGTGITQHDVVLPAVQPGVQYSYVIEGVTADGSLYRSKLATFRIGTAGSTPTTAAAAAPPGKNIAPTAKVAKVSSEFSSAFAAANAIDDDTATEWATNGDGNHGSITLDLGSTVAIKGVEFVTRSMADGSSITSTYTVSVDEAAPAGPFPAATVGQSRPVVLAARGRTVRFDVTQSSGGNVGAVEIRVYA
jgi:hypothetical protein